MSLRPRTPGWSPWSLRVARRLSDRAARLTRYWRTGAARSLPRRWGRSSAAQRFAASRSHPWVILVKLRYPRGPNAARSHTSLTRSVSGSRRPCWRCRTKQRRTLCCSPQPAATSNCSSEVGWRLRRLAGDLAKPGGVGHRPVPGPLLQPIEDLHHHRLGEPVQADLPRSLDGRFGLTPAVLVEAGIGAAPGAQSFVVAAAVAPVPAFPTARIDLTRLASPGRPRRPRRRSCRRRACRRGSGTCRISGRGHRPGWCIPA